MSQVLARPAGGVPADGDVRAAAAPPARRRRQRASIAALIVVTTGALIAVVVARPGARTDGTASETRLHTATVVRSDIVNREQLDGTLGYAPAPSALVARRGGVLTSVAAEGARVDRGQTLFTIDGEPVVLLLGPTPAYRDLVEGMRGQDVRQLKENLVALGHATWPDVGDDDRYSAGTASAVQRLQAAVGADETGIVVLGDAVFLPSAVRIAAHTTAVGSSIAGGSEITGITSTERVVTVELDASKQGRVNVGDPVEIELPSGATTAGTISDIAEVAERDDTGSSDGGQTTVDVTVTLSDPAATGTLDQAPVTVAITTEAAEDVLAVPVTALLALAEGGYGVEVVASDGTRRLVSVETGIFSDSDDLVEIRNGDLREGDTVVTSE